MATPPARAQAGSADASSGWPGKRLGLPETGSRSIARVGRRLVAVAIDWGIALAVAVIFFRYDVGGRTTSSSVWLVPTIFAVEQVLFISVLAGSIGQLILGMRVVPLRPQWIGIWRPALRTILLCLVIPAVIFDSDQRGLHDKIAGTILVRR